MTKKLKFPTLLILASLFSVLVLVGCKEKDSREPQFDIYGTWNYVVTPSSFREWTVAPPDITINPDNTVSALFYESRYNGVISGTDTYQLRVRILSLWAEGDEYPVDDDEVWVLTYDPATNLLKYGDNVFRKKTEHEFRHEVWFNDVSFPMTVFYSPLSDGGYSLDSLVFIYDGARQAVHLHDLDEPLHIFDFDPDNFHHITVSDFNFDGYMDIQIYDILRSGASNMRYKFFLYNPQSKAYYYHHELSEMDEVWADAETQTVKTRGSGGDGGMTYSFREYKWVGSELTLIRSENQEKDGASERFIRTTRTLQNGEWVQQTDTISVEDL
jgi:hypothetical protein